MWKNYVKDNYHKVAHLPQNQRLKALSDMRKGQSTSSSEISAKASLRKPKAKAMPAKAMPAKAMPAKAMPKKGRSKSMSINERMLTKGGAIPWNWEYLDPSRGISEQLQDYFIKGMVGQTNPLQKATMAEIKKAGGNELTLEFNHRYWDAKDEGNRLFNAVAVDNQARADAPSAAERIATNLTGAVAEGATKALMA